MPAAHLDSALLVSLDTCRHGGDMAQSDREMTISELSSRAGLSVSTIKFYIRRELLPKPIKTGKTRGVYNRRHLYRLQLIQKIRKEGNLGLEKIRAITSVMDAWEEDERRERKPASSEQEEVILDAATALFRAKGYEGVTIADIVEGAGIGRSTFYKHFRDKKGLFIACLRRIILREGIPEPGTEGEETDLFTAFDKSAQSYFRDSPLWRDMIKRLRAAAINDPEEFEGMLEEALGLKIDRFERRIRKTVEQGFLRAVNPKLLAVMLLGIQDSCAEYISRGQFDESPDRLFEEVKDIILYGVLQKRESSESA